MAFCEERAIPSFVTGPLDFAPFNREASICASVRMNILLI
jgi:hypothetical protein